MNIREGKNRKTTGQKIGLVLGPILFILMITLFRPQTDSTTMPAMAAVAILMATLVGTPPNLSFARIFQITFPGAEPISFGTWFVFGIDLNTLPGWAGPLGGG